MLLIQKMGHIDRHIMLNDKEKECSLIKWIGKPDPNIEVPTHLANKNVSFYHKCLYGSLTLNIGDSVLISTADVLDIMHSYDVGKILYMYELKESSRRDQLTLTIRRAIVQWYSWPTSIPHRHYDDNVSIDFDKEIIEDYRLYDADIALDTIIGKCSILYGTIDCSAEELLNNCRRRTNTCPIFVCRYKYKKIKSSYQLVPMQFSNGKEVGVQRTTESPSKNNERALRYKRRASMYSTYQELVNVNQENTVSPIKILNGTNLLRVSDNDNDKVESVSSRKSQLLASPLAEANIKVVPRTPLSSVKARRNLNISLEGASAKNTTAHSDCLNYSIVKTTSDADSLENDMKIKLRISQRQRSKRLITNEEDPLALTNAESIDMNVFDLYKSPTKKLKETIVDGANDKRKSILKSAGSHNLGTPKRNIQLSNVVKQHVFIDNDIRCTPKTNKPTNRNMDINYVHDDNDDNCHADIDDVEMCTPRKSLRRTPNKARRSLLLNSNADHLNDNDTHDSDIGDPVFTPHTPRISNRKTPNKPRNDEELKAESNIKYTPRGNCRNRNVSEGDVKDICLPLQKTPSKRGKLLMDIPSTPKTPREKLKMLRSGQITPSIKQRVSIVGQEEQYKTVLDKARECLHVSVVPQSLPCREKEFNDIYTFVAGKIQDQCGGCMYISGVPGTGKTATVTAVIKTLQQQSANGDLPQFDYLDINGMRLTEPRQAYVHIYRQLTGKTVSWEHAYTLLEKHFTAPASRRLTTVLLVDELDILCNRRQDVVYNLLDWPTKFTAHLVVITIANTMDLPERLLHGKLTSRLGLTRLTFQPYTHKQLHEIVLARLQGSLAFQNDAIQLAARKVAAVSGDARRALDICRRATEIADTAVHTAIVAAIPTVEHNISITTATTFVNMMHVQQALSEMIASAKVQAIKHCSRLEKIFLKAMVTEYNRTGVEEMSFMGVYMQLETITNIMRIRTPTPGQALLICNKLGSARIIIGEHSRNDLFQKIILNVSTDDIHYALKLHKDLI